MSHVGMELIGLIGNCLLYSVGDREFSMVDVGMTLDRCNWKQSAISRLALHLNGELFESVPAG